MTNSWSLLYDTMSELKNDTITILGSNVTEATSTDWNDFWMDDGFSLTGNPYAYDPVHSSYATDTISFDLDMTNTIPIVLSTAKNELLKN